MSLTVAAALAAAQAQPAAPAAAPAPDYAAASGWLCRPGRADACSMPIDMTALEPSGYGARLSSVAAADPSVDCFYIYPTVSRDRGLNSDLAPGEGEEKRAARNQMARLASVCRPFAPLYRQMTASAVAAAMTGADLTAPTRLAYGDVVAAWKHYLAHDNGGRPFVLIGHSQGALMLQQLLADVIEGRPEAKRMKLAILPGYNVFVPIGKTVGGTFRTTPICTRSGQTGCVLTWVSYREKNAPPPGAVFGHGGQPALPPAGAMSGQPLRPGMTIACTNPAAPGATGWAKLDSFVDARSSLPVPGGPVLWSSEGPSPSPYLVTKGLLSARCVNDGPRGYLSVRINADPADKRTDRIGGEVGAMGFFLPGWGMHLIDLAAPMENLRSRIGAIALAERRGAPGRSAVAAGSPN